MLTIKNVLPTGHEDIVEVKRVSLGKEENPLAKDAVDRYTAVVYGEMDNGITMLFNEGTVYVMNSSGKTVANYSLKWPAPSHETFEPEVA